ncbi:hypothetical protein L6R29_16065, partial [Myxococcota bacterium]|nr:hypothetical protein [Myxococcota bacterium]
SRTARWLGSHRGLPLHFYDHSTGGSRLRGDITRRPFLRCFCLPVQKISLFRKHPPTPPVKTSIYRPTTRSAHPYTDHPHALPIHPQTIHTVKAPVHRPTTRSTHPSTDHPHDQSTCPQTHHTLCPSLHRPPTRSAHPSTDHPHALPIPPQAVYIVKEPVHRPCTLSAHPSTDHARRQPIPPQAVHIVKEPVHRPPTLSKHPSTGHPHDPPTLSAPFSVCSVFCEARNSRWSLSVDCSFRVL